jgi:hypothetical protein
VRTLCRQQQAVELLECTFGAQRLQALQRDCIRVPERPGLTAAQHRHVRAAAERNTDVLRKHAHVGALACQHAQAQLARSPARNSRRSSAWIVIRRASRSTVSPLRASSYSGTPPRFSAEYIGGTCSMSPRKRASTASSAASSTTAALRSASTAPSASPVSVVTPRHSVATYSLSESSRNCDHFVASPKHSGNTPVASGSRLPVCPALRAK